MSTKTIGVLALQGAFSKHISMIQQLGIDAIEVRRNHDLNNCDGLIIPGGESTTIMRQLDFSELTDSIKKFSIDKPVFGTCAGMILMAKQVVGDSIEPMGLVDITIERNGYGRQVDSFTTTLTANCKNVIPIKCVFIRAPRIKSYGTEVKVLASHNNEAVFVQQGRHLACSFHPELTEDLSCHKYFLTLV